MVLICVKWSITCWLTEEHPETEVGLVTSGCNMVLFDCMLICILSVSVEALEMMHAKTAEALVHWAWELKPVIC